MHLKRLFLVPVIFFPLLAMAQPNADFGVFAGTAYYLGDINPSKHFYRPSFSYGVLYRININTRYALRANGYIADLTGDDRDFPERINPDRPFSPRHFQTSLLDLGLQLEINFLPYTPNLIKWDYTPYIAAGVAGSMILGSDAEATNTLGFPFGVGVKFNITSRISAGAEYSFRKTFSDRLDGVENPSDVSSFLHNNDWYSFLGVFITFKFFNFAADCPAYN